MKHGQNKNCGYCSYLKSLGIKCHIHKDLFCHTLMRPQSLVPESSALMLC